MVSIHLIFTRHCESGACNSYELYRIIDSVKPEIIFEELSQANFDKAYNYGTLKTLETDAVKMYLKNNLIRQIPLDSSELPESYDEDLEYMLDQITCDTRIPESCRLRKMIEQQQLLGSLHGFSFLNSNHNNLLFKEINALTAEVVRIKNNTRISAIYNLHESVVQQREDEILNNIYRYSKKDVSGKALLFLGSGHRESFLRKIQKQNDPHQPLIEWMLW